MEVQNKTNRNSINSNFTSNCKNYQMNCQTHSETNKLKSIFLSPKRDQGKTSKHTTTEEF